MEQTTIFYTKLRFDSDGFWDSEQFEDILPIQFWREDVPDQVRLDVLLKFWRDVGVEYTEIVGDPENFDYITKHINHDGKLWCVEVSGNMAVRAIREM